MFCTLQMSHSGCLPRHVQLQLPCPLPSICYMPTCVVKIKHVVSDIVDLYDLLLTSTCCACAVLLALRAGCLAVGGGAPWQRARQPRLHVHLGGLLCTGAVHREQLQGPQPVAAATALCDCTSPGTAAAVVLAADACCNTAQMAACTMVAFMCLYLSSVGGLSADPVYFQQQCWMCSSPAIMHHLNTLVAAWHVCRSLSVGTLAPLLSTAPVIDRSFMTAAMCLGAANLLAAKQSSLQPNSETCLVFLG